MIPLTEKNKGGRPAKVVPFENIRAICSLNPTREQTVNALAIMGYDIGIKVLEKIIKEETGLLFEDFKNRCTDGTRIKLIQKAIKMALDGDRTMLIFSLKNMCKWSDRVEHEYNGEPVKISLSYDPSGKHGKRAS